MEWLLENIGPLAFLFLFVLPVVKKIAKRRREEEKKRATGVADADPGVKPKETTASLHSGGKTVRPPHHGGVKPKETTASLHSGGASARGPSEKQEQPPPKEGIRGEKNPWADPSPRHPILTTEGELPSLAMPSAKADWSFGSLPRGNDEAYQKKKAPFPRKRIALLPPLKQAIIWKEILDPPRGL